MKAPLSLPEMIKCGSALVFVGRSCYRVRSPQTTPVLVGGANAISPLVPFRSAGFLANTTTTTIFSRRAW